MTAHLPLTPVIEGGDQQLDQLLQTLFPERGQERDELTGRLLRAVQRQCSGPQLHERVVRAGEEQLRARVKLGQRILREYFTQPVFHHDLARSLLRNSGGLLARTLEPRGWLTQTGSAEQELLALIARVGAGWSPATERSDRIRGLLVSWLTELGSDRPADPILAQARERERELRAVCQRRVQAVVDEPGMSRLAAQRRAARTLNRQIAGRDQPAFMVRDLHQHWFPALCRVLEEQGADSELERRLVRILSLVIWALQPGMETSSRRDKLQRTANQLNRELPELLPLVQPDEEVRDRIIDYIEVTVYSVLYGRQVARQPVPPFDEQVPPTDEQLGEEVPALLNRLGQDDWLQLESRDLRAFVMARQAKTGDWILADALGRRVFACQRDELARDLVSGAIWMVPNPSSPAELIRRRLDVLNGYLQARMGGRSRAG
jgi:hypothetical protein